MKRRAWRAGFAAALCSLVLPLAACGSGDSSSAPSAVAPATRTPAPATTGASATVPAELPPLRLEKLASGFRRPTFVTNAGDGSGRLFVVEKGGTIRTLVNGVADSTPFLDIASLVTSSGNEQGLLGLAFHPKFGENGRFFVTYTARDGGANTLAEYAIDRATGRGVASSGKVLISIPDKFANHNGGMIAFGRDGYLYLGTGDGGSAGDPDGNGQNLKVLLGKILRLDVDATGPQGYGAPADNPFISTAGARPEIWAYGLRNPWRFSFDRATGDLWIGDVGQGAWEEIDLQPASSDGGENYGWSVLEGTHCYKPSSGCDPKGAVAPVHEYSHDEGCSVTGGYVYRGAALAAAAGSYFFIDYCEGKLQALRPAAGSDARTVAEVLETGAGVSSFGEDEQGELYLTGDGDGTIYRLAAK